MLNKDLLPCPCCGNVHIHEFSPEEWSFVTNPYWKIKCCKCGLTMCGSHRKLNQNTWNTRADTRTCEWTLREEWPNNDGYASSIRGYETQCGHKHTWWPDALPTYCPSCGGKAVLASIGDDTEESGEADSSTRGHSKIKPHLVTNRTTGNKGAISHVR